MKVLEKVRSATPFCIYCVILWSMRWCQGEVVLFRTFAQHFLPGEQQLCKQLSLSSHQTLHLSCVTPELITTDETIILDPRGLEHYDAALPHRDAAQAHIPTKPSQHTCISCSCAITVLMKIENLCATSINIIQPDANATRDQHPVHHFATARIVVIHVVSNPQKQKSENSDILIH